METEEQAAQRLTAEQEPKTTAQKNAEMLVEKKRRESMAEYDDTDKDAKKGQFVVVHPIKENGKKFDPNDDYTGKNENRYLANGQIRKKD